MGQANRERRRRKEQARRQARAQQPRPEPAGAGAPGSAAAAAAKLAGQCLPPERPTVQQQIAAIVSDAGQAYVIGDGEALADAVERLVEHPDVDGWRSVGERSFDAYLRNGVTAAWERGWQPADVARAVGRRFGGRHVHLIGDAIAAELQGYAAATIDPRWSPQLAEISDGAWWPSNQTFLGAWCGLPKNDWASVLPLALELTCLLFSLPMLEQLGPRPGTARPPASGAARPGPEVDERMLSRIRALLAKAEATTSEAEAEAFTAGAQERMARHSIDLAMLAATDPTRADAPSGRRIGIDNPYEASKAVLLNAVATANRCRSVWSSNLGFCTVVGFEPDLDAVETLFTSLLVQAVTAMTRAGSRTGPGGRSRTRSFRQSFLAAYAHRIGERLSEVIEVQTEAASAEPGGANLLPVLASRNQAVDDTLSTMFPTLTMKSTGSITDAEGWHSGRGAADLASLHTGQALKSPQA